MKKIKLKKANWRKLVKNALVSTLVLAAIALCYGDYLVEKIGDNYKEAQIAANALAVNDVKQIALPMEENMPPDNAMKVEKTDSIDEMPILAKEIQPEIADTATQEPTNEPTQSMVRYQRVGSVAAVINAPCQAPAMYGYGYGYDPVYKDIRFHDHALYQADEDFEILAVDEGIIEEVGNKDDGWFVRIRHEWGISEYRGLDKCSLMINQSVNAGEVLAVAPKVYYYLYVEE